MKEFNEDGQHDNTLFAIALFLLGFFAGASAMHSLSQEDRYKYKVAAYEELYEEGWRICEQKLTDEYPLIINTVDAKDGIEWRWDRVTEAHIVNKPKGTTRAAGVRNAPVVETRPLSTNSPLYVNATAPHKPDVIRFPRIYLPSEY